jgi:hypothetical protein
MSKRTVTKEKKLDDKVCLTDFGSGLLSGPLTRNGIINLYREMIYNASQNIGKTTIFNTHITKEFIDRLESRKYQLIHRIRKEVGRFNG